MSKKTKQAYQDWVKEQLDYTMPIRLREHRVIDPPQEVPVMHINVSYEFPDMHQHIYRIIEWPCHCYTAYFFNGLNMWEEYRTADDCVTHCKVKVI